MSAPAIWWITTGEAGFRSQARGLAEAVAPGAVEKTIGLKAPWSLAPPPLWPLTLRGLDADQDQLAPPWPDLVISCGRKAAKAAIAVKRASRSRALAVHIQNPLAPLGEFDLVIAMRHDGIDGPNVMQVDTALHHVTPELLADAACAWREPFAALPRPLTGVLVGGSTRRHPFTRGHVRILTGGLPNVLAEGGGSALITPSRRTPIEVKQQIADAFAGKADTWIWDGTGDNPYLGILALSDRLLVTSDSVSMVSEAMASGHPVAAIDLGGGRRHRRFLANLVERKLVRPFTGEPWPTQPGPPINATPAAAAAVRRLLYARTGMSG